MFERFTERARQVVVLAQEESRVLGHNYIGTEHVLLGICREEEGLGARALENFDIHADSVRQFIKQMVGVNEEEVTSGPIPFTPRAKKVLELALREALVLGHNYIGTEHILLGLVREDDGVAARIITEHGIDAEAIRNKVIRTLSGPGGRRSDKPYDDPKTPEQVELDAKITEARKNKERAIDDHQFQEASSFRDQERKLTKAMRELQKQQSADAHEYSLEKTAMVINAMFVENHMGSHIFLFDSNIVEEEGLGSRAGYARITIPIGGDPLRFQFGEKVQITISKEPS